MSCSTNLPVYSRAYLGTIPRLAREDQLALCQAAVAAHDDVPPFADAVYGPRDWDAFVRDVRRDEVAVLPRLIALDERPPVGGRAGAAFLLRIAELAGACRFIVDADAELRSTDRAAWREHCGNVHGAITRGRALTTKRASAMGHASAEAAEPGIVDHWLALAGKPTHRRVARHWRDPTMTAAEAIECAPDEAGDLRDASRRTWERIFGRRTTRPYRRRT